MIEFSYPTRSSSVRTARGRTASRDPGQGADRLGWIRTQPQRGLSLAMLRTSSQTSGLIGGRAGRSVLPYVLSFSRAPGASGRASPG